MTQLQRIEQLELKLKQAYEQIAQFEEQENIRQRYERLFESRNRALRIFFESTLKIDDNVDISTILCYSLQRICQAFFVGFVEYDQYHEQLKLHTSYDGSETLVYSDEHVIDLTTSHIRELSKKGINPASIYNIPLTSLIPAKYHKQPADSITYCLPMVIRKRLLGVVIMQLPQKKDLILKDIIESSLHYWGMALQRELDKQELLESKMNLTRSEEEVRMVIENCGVPMCVFNKNFKIIKCNRHFVHLCEVAPEQIPNKSYFELFGSMKCCTDFCNVTKTENGLTSYSVVQELDINGKTVFAHVIITPFSQNSVLDGYVVAIHDISEQKKMEAQLQTSNTELTEKNQQLEQAQSCLVETSKMSAVGTLSAGIAHEFNNILTIMCGYLDLCSHSKNLDDIANALQIMSDVANRARAITDGLLHFANTNDNHNKTAVDIPNLIEGTLVLIDKEFAKQGIQVITDFEEIPATYCFEHQLAQVFMSIISNARDAMLNLPERVLTISVRHCCTPNLKQEQNSQKEAIRISFKDTGIGMSKEVQDKMFEPFFTTKGVLADGMQTKAGTGLDMATAYNIIKRHNGTFEIESEVNKGTTITISLPLDTCGGLLYD